MADLTNITDEPRELVLAHGEFTRVVEPGESVDISDYILARYAWPAATWRIGGTDVVTLQGDAYVAAPAATPAVVDAELPTDEKSE